MRGCPAGGAAGAASELRSVPLVTWAGALPEVQRGCAGFQGRRMEARGLRRGVIRWAVGGASRAERRKRAGGGEREVTGDCTGPAVPGARGDT